MSYGQRHFSPSPCGNLCSKNCCSAASSRGSYCKPHGDGRHGLAYLCPTSWCLCYSCRPIWPAIPCPGPCSCLSLPFVSASYEIALALYILPLFCMPSIMPGTFSSPVVPLFSTPDKECHLWPPSGSQYQTYIGWTVNERNGISPLSHCLLAG